VRALRELRYPAVDPVLTFGLPLANAATPSLADNTSADTLLAKANQRLSDKGLTRLSLSEIVFFGTKLQKQRLPGAQGFEPLIEPAAYA
jgi:hypothetical protein